MPKTVATVGAGWRSGGRFGALFGRGAVLRAAVVPPAAVTAAPFSCLAVRVLLRSGIGRRSGPGARRRGDACRQAG